MFSHETSDKVNLRCCTQPPKPAQQDEQKLGPEIYTVRPIYDTAPFCVG